jgi:catechol 2,3-dioxygenase-like lactoylglutathione lyase family enzyme
MVRNHFGRGDQGVRSRPRQDQADLAGVRQPEDQCTAARRDKVEWFTADQVAAGSDDLCFLTSSSPEQVVTHLKANGVAIEEGPVAKQGARGTLRSVYCRDPDGSLIEISSYGNLK